MRAGGRTRLSFQRTWDQRRHRANQGFVIGTHQVLKNFFPLDISRRGRATCGSLGGNPDAVKTLCEQWGVVNILDKTGTNTITPVAPTLTGIALALGGLEMYPKKERPQDCDFTTAITGWIEFTSQLHQRVNTIEQQLQAILGKSSTKCS